MKHVEVVLTRDVDLKNSVLIEGFPGVGLVGTIAVSYIVEKTGMKAIGYIDSESFPPIITIHKGRPYFPMRIYKHPSKDFCVLLAEFVTPSDVIHELAKKILSFAKEKGIRQIISLAGMSMPENERESEIFGIASNEEMQLFLASKNVKAIEEGVTTGVSGMLIAECARENFPAITLLAQSEYKVPNPRASAELIKKLDELIGLEVDTSELLREAKEIEKKMKGLMSKSVKEKKMYKEVEDSLMYE
ncbi:hypothetical protein DRN74_00090 [Candidatus Micrarchaeota archaeon]|nr:MAG: hypothetical protein DRN74_00090 [Candidatus Micrarchaeota archaeon]